MNKKEELKRLNKYLDFLKSRLTSDLPSKHKHRQKSFVQFLQKDIQLTQFKIDSLMKEG